MRIYYSDYFLKSARKLPLTIQTRLAKNLSLLEQSPFHALLHTKALSGNLAGFYSFRVTRDWRVIFQFLEEDCIKLIDVGHRKDIYL